MPRKLKVPWDSMLNLRKMLMPRKLKVFWDSMLASSKDLNTEKEVTGNDSKNR